MPLYYHAHRLRVFLAAGSAPEGCEVADKSRVRSVVDLVTTVLVALTACVALVKLLQPPSPSTQRNRPEPAVPTAPIPVGELPQAKHLDECRPTKESRLRRMADGNKTLQIQGTPTLFLGQVTRSKTVLVKKRWTGVISAEVLGDSMKQLGNQPVER
jgi:hypothetical protein